MSDLQRTTPQSNPFSTRYVQPGAIEFQFGAGESTEQLVAALERSGWRGQIIGPHGSGKSTLLASLLEPLARAGRPAIVFFLRDGQRRLPAEWRASARNQPARTIVIDGYEQLGRWQRAIVSICCRLSGWGLLVTAHRDVGLPTLYETVPSVELVVRIVARLLANSDHAIPRGEIERALADCQGNVREALFVLYDLYERQRAVR